MAIFKYKTHKDAEIDLWNFHPDDAYFISVSKLWDFANKLCPIRYPEGIFKFQSPEEANRHRNACELAFAKKLPLKR